MPAFQYAAIDRQGGDVKGQLDAPDKHAAAASLRSQALFPTGLERAKLAEFEEALSSEGDASLGHSIAGLLPVKTHDRVFFLQQLALMLRTGITLLQALEICQEQSSKRQLAQSIQRMIDSIQTGKSLSQAMAAERRLFSRMTIKLVECSEASGEVDQAARYLEQQAQLIGQLVNSLIYPVVVILTAIAVGTFLVVKVIPKFAAFLSRQQVKLPWSTQLLMDLSTFLTKYGLMILAVCIATAVAIAIVYTTNRGRLVIDRFMLRVPVVGGLLTVAASKMLWEAVQPTLSLPPQAALEAAVNQVADEERRTWFLHIVNQDDFRSYVQDLTSILDDAFNRLIGSGVTNPEINRCFHISVANNQGGDPLKSIGSIRPPENA